MKEALPIPMDTSERGVAAAIFDSQEERDRYIAGSLMQSVRDDKEYFWTSLPAETRADKVKIHQALTRSENDIEDLMTPAGFAVSDCILSRIQYTNESGETVSGPKLTLIGPDRSVKSIIARIFCEQFLQLFAIFGMPPWDEPLVVRAKHNKGNGKNRFYSLELLS